MSDQRKYSVSEIDAMRQAIRWSYPDNVPFYQEERTKEIEELIRTYMAGGADPKEVAETYWKQSQARQAMQQRMSK
jgi:ABC-type glycerol-3-phosphate transport system substrate-binding protein